MLHSVWLAGWKTFATEMTVHTPSFEQQKSSKLVFSNSRHVAAACLSTPVNHLLPVDIVQVELAVVPLADEIICYAVKGDECVSGKGFYILILSQLQSVLRQKEYVEAFARKAFLNIDKVRDDPIRKRNSREFNQNSDNKQQVVDRQAPANLSHWCHLLPSPVEVQP